MPLEVLGNVLSIIGSFGSVSYTHLDVYKRQEESKSIAIGNALLHVNTAGSSNIVSSLCAVLVNEMRLIEPLTCDLTSTGSNENFITFVNVDRKLYYVTLAK